jgi:hypothetical protein
MDLNKINWKKSEAELETLFSDRFRRIWIQYTRLNTLCITLFPVDRNANYKFITEYKVQDWSVENLKNIVLSKI